MMESTFLSSIKQSSIKAVFDYISFNNQVSRSDIAFKTGLSLMTVGKIVDALTELGVLLQLKELKTAIGRKACLVELNHDKYALVLNIADRNFTLSVVNAALIVVYNFTYIYDVSYYYDVNFMMFLNDVKDVLYNQLTLMDCIGVGIIVSGFYDSCNDIVKDERIPESANLNIKRITHEIIGIEPEIICEETQSAMIAYLSSEDISRDEILYYLKYGKMGNINGLLYVNKRFICTFPGKMILHDSLLPDDFQKLNLYDFASFIQNIIVSVNPDIIIIECLNEKQYDLLNKKLLNELKNRFNKIPKISIIHDNGGYSQIGMAITIRNVWFEKLVIN